MTSLRAARLLAGLVSLLGLALVAPLPAGGTTTTVSVQDFSFTPGSVSVGMGQTVTWSFHAMHTTTSNQGFWDSGHRDAGSSYAVRFRDAGTFRYHCSMHPEMTGQVRVPMSRTGRPGAGYHLRWSVRTSTPANRRFDVQFKRAGASAWVSFRHVTTKRTAFFNPARNGTYVFRARTRNVGVGVSSWSPVLSVRIA
jgi:plastocyanin